MNHEVNVLSKSIIILMKRTTRKSKEHNTIMHIYWFKHRQLQIFFLSKNITINDAPSVEPLKDRLKAKP